MVQERHIVVEEGHFLALHNRVRWASDSGWDGTVGISSSSIADNPGRTVGIVQEGDGARIRFTWVGDANLDGMVTIADLSILAANWQRGVDDGQTVFWGHGDFNYDGRVNIADLSLLAANWQAGVPAGAPGSDMSFAEAMAMFDVFDGIVIPEPASLGLAGLAGLLFLRRRR
jgi:hypothetical protein